MVVIAIIVVRTVVVGFDIIIAVSCIDITWLAQSYVKGGGRLTSGSDDEVGVDNTMHVWNVVDETIRKD